MFSMLAGLVGRPVMLYIALGLLAMSITGNLIQNYKIDNCKFDLGKCNATIEYKDKRIKEIIINAKDLEKYAQEQCEGLKAYAKKMQNIPLPNDSRVLVPDLLRSFLDDERVRGEEEPIYPGINKKEWKDRSVSPTKAH